MKGRQQAQEDVEKSWKPLNGARCYNREAVPRCDEGPPFRWCQREAFVWVNEDVVQSERDRGNYSNVTGRKPLLVSARFISESGRYFTRSRTVLPCAWRN